MTRTAKLLFVAGGFMLLVLLGGALSNMSSTRKLIPVEGLSGPWTKLSPVLQEKCVDCHAPEFAHLPFYAKAPPASWLIAKDQRKGLDAWELTRDEISGHKPLDESALAALEWVVTSGDMPPAQYLLMHWLSRVTDRDRGYVRAYVTVIRSATPEAQQMSPTHRGEPLQPLLAPSNLNLEVVELGRLLFLDPRLSGDGSISCATCHSLKKGGVDQAPVSTGIRGQKGGINDPTVFNVSYNFRQFWDGRAADLYEQAGGPVENPIEMGAEFPAVITKLSEVDYYRQRFAALYPAEGITKRTIIAAIAEFEKSLVTVGSRFDRYLEGDDHAIAEQERKGYERFKSSGCTACHFGPAVGGRTFEKFGVVRDYFAERGHVKEEDYGRFNVTHEPKDRFKFKVPILRNVNVTHPYFHDGSVKSLKQAVRVMARYQLRDELSDQDVEWIVAFLPSLTGTYEGRPVDKP